MKGWYQLKHTRSKHPAILHSETDRGGEVHAVHLVSDTSSPPDVLYAHGNTHASFSTVWQPAAPRTTPHAAAAAAATSSSSRRAGLARAARCPAPAPPRGLPGAAAPPARARACLEASGVYPRAGIVHPAARCWPVGGRGAGRQHQQRVLPCLLYSTLAQRGGGAPETPYSTQWTPRFSISRRARERQEPKQEPKPAGHKGHQLSGECTIIIP